MILRILYHGRSKIGDYKYMKTWHCDFRAISNIGFGSVLPMKGSEFDTGN